MPTQNKSILANLYFENTIVSVIILALVVLFAKLVFPEQADRISNILIPLFIVVACLEIYFIRTQVKEVREKIDDDFLFRSFASGEEFDNYLANRFKGAREVKVIHMSSGTSGKREGRRYYEIVGEFVQQGGRFTRILSDTSNADVFRWIKEDLIEYEQYKYFIHFVPEVLVGEIKTIGIMIIDKEEVCLGGGYDTSFDHPTISLIHEYIVKFFLDYFEYLSYRSDHIRSDIKNVKWEYLDNLIEEAEKRSSRIQQVTPNNSLNRTRN